MDSQVKSGIETPVNPLMGAFYPTSDMRGASVAALLRLQARVIGALILREMHTRFGRHNIGYLWMIMEPMMLAIGITIVHLQWGTSTINGLDATPFWIAGYTPWCLFRSQVMRACGAIEGNATLFYHRQVTLLDILISRTLLEAGALTFALALLLGLAAALGYGKLPERPLLMLLGMGLLTWLGFGLSLIVCVLTELSNTIERIMHPAMYLALPVSGVFYVLAWLPDGFARVLRYSPTAQLLDMIRAGQFASIDARYTSVTYLLTWCAMATLIGLFSIKLIRKRIEVG